jgi:hypothetical protein
MEKYKMLINNDGGEAYDVCMYLGLRPQEFFWNQVRPAQHTTRAPPADSGSMRLVRDLRVWSHPEHTAHGVCYSLHPLQHPGDPLHPVDLV